MKAFLLFFGFICMFSFAYAHSGRTDANGCHTNRKTGTYHCHGKSKKKISAARPVVSKSGNINKKASAKSDKLSQTEDKKEKEASKKKKVAIKNKKEQSKSTNKAENITKSIKGNKK